MRIPWQNNGPRILLSLSSLSLFIDHPPRRITADTLGGRKRGRADETVCSRVKTPSGRPNSPLSSPRTFTRTFHVCWLRVLSVDYIGTCAVASQPAARQNYTNRGVALSTAWYLVAYGTVRIARYYPPCLRVLAGPSRFFADQVCLFFVPCFLNSWNWWLFVRGLCRV